MKSAILNPFHFISPPIKMGSAYPTPRPIFATPQATSYKHIPPMETIRIAIIEDEPLVRENLSGYLARNPVFQIEIIADSVEAFLAEFDAHPRKKPDILLLDIGLPGMSGLEGIRLIRQRLPELDIMMLTTFEEDDKIFKALCAGACSYLTKRTPLPQIQEAVLTVHRGGSFMSPSIARRVANYFAPKPKSAEDKLTPRQRQIVEGLAEGLSYKGIAEKYLVTLETVRDHIKNIYKTLSVNSRAEVVRKLQDGEI